jgi:hypothetical protein
MIAQHDISLFSWSIKKKLKSLLQSWLVSIVIQQSFPGDEFHFNFFISCVVKEVVCFVHAW